jgi:hypothetical protein
MAGYEYINETGLIVPDTSTLRALVETQYKDRFGQDLDVSGNTPQGLFINLAVLTRAFILQSNAVTANQFNPNYAGGIFLDADAALMGLERTLLNFSIVSINMAGVPGAVISAGVRVRDANYNYFASLEEVTLDGEGNATTIFQAEIAGAITAAPNTLTFIVDGGELGWETATNPIAAIPGSAPQSDIKFRRLRVDTLGLQADSVMEAIKAGLANLTGVSGPAIVLENVTDEIIVEAGVTLTPHSIYVCVDGGTDEAVADVIFEKKSGGCGYNNGSGDPVEVEITDEDTGVIYPILFDRPTDIPLLARVTIKANSQVTDPESAVKNAIVDYAAGNIDGEAGFIVGASASSFELSGAVNIQNPSLHVKLVEIALVSDGIYSTDEIPIAVWERATITAGAITVVFV